MEPHELHILRRRARRDGDLQHGPVRLYSEVIDLTIMDECRARYTTLAGWLGTTPRTIRRWRDRLVDAGYLRVEEGAPDRLIPTEPPEDEEQGQSRDRTETSADRTAVSDGPDESVRSSTPDRTCASGEPDSCVRSAPDESVRYIRDNIPQAGGPESECESARAREAPAGDGEVGKDPSSLDVSAYDSDLKDHPAVEAHQEIFPAVSLGQIQREKIASTVDDLDLWRDVLEWWALQDHRARSIARQLKKFREDRNDQRTGTDRSNAAESTGGGSGGGGGNGAPSDRGGAW